ncbi:predicted protein, partial [Nematostella vectensis]
MGLSLRDCQPCAVGSYQDNEGEEFCKLCPQGKTSRETGAKSQDMCLEICSSGSYSPQGVGGCLPCFQGTYQPNSKAKSSIQCPPGTTTVKEGSTSASQC